MSDSKADPFADLGDERKPVSNFWKPNRREKMIGKLDRIEDGKKFGDRAVFPDAIIFRGDDHKPIRRGEVLLGISANLAGRINPEDSGKFFIITFREFAEASGSNNPARLFDVAVVPADKEATVRAALRKAADQLKAETDQSEDEDDDLPF